MAYQRQTQVFFYQNVSIDDENKLWFGSGIGQETFKGFFDSHFTALSTTADLSHQREEGSFVRLDILNSSITSNWIQAANFLIYINPNNENMYFFAHITQHEYVNDNCWHLHFEIDQFLTWAHTLEIQGGRVERHNYPNELNPASTTAQRIEQVDCGEYTTCYHEDVIFDRIGMEVRTLLDEQGQIRPDTYGSAMLYPNIIDGKLAYGGTFYADSGSVGSAEAMADFVNNIVYQYKDFPEALINLMMFAFPTRLDIELPIAPPLGGENPNPWTKCYKYPMMYIRVTNGLGDEKRYYMEHFHDPNASNDVRTAPTFRMLNINYSQYAATILVPLNYKGVARNFQEAFIYDRFPMIQWIKDNFGQWYAVNAQRQENKLVGGLAAAAIGTVVGVATANPLAIIGDVSAGIGTAVNYMDTLNAQAKQPDALMGSPSIGGALQLLLNQQGFHFDIMRPINGLVTVNNSYFNSFGYRAGICGKPNMNTNPFWNYVKGDFMIKCGGTTKTKDYIRNCFNNGVRLWHNNGTFGDLGQDNRA